MLGECQMLLKSLTAHTFKVLPQLKYADYLHSAAQSLQLYIKLDTAIYHC